MIRSAQPRSVTLAALGLAAGLVVVGIAFGVAAGGLGAVQVAAGGGLILALLGLAAVAGRAAPSAQPRAGAAPPPETSAPDWPVAGRSSLDRLAGRLAAAERPGRVHEAGLHDPLTQLPGRALLQELLQKQLARARRSGELTGVILCDIDDLKAINERFGHAAGDRLLQEVARRLSRDVREADSVARTGEDEFTLVIGGAAAAKDVRLAAERILAGMQAPVAAGDHEILISVSLGVSVCPRDAEEAEVLLDSAETARAAARAQGGNRVRAFSADMGQGRCRRGAPGQELGRGGVARPGLDGG